MASMSDFSALELTQVMFAAESSDNCAGLEVISNKIVHETIWDVMRSIFTKTGEFSINSLFFEGWESKGEV